MEKDEVKKLGSSEVLNLITSILQNTRAYISSRAQCREKYPTPYSR